MIREQKKTQIYNTQYKHATKRHYTKGVLCKLQTSYNDSLTLQHGKTMDNCAGFTRSTKTISCS